MSNSTIKIRLMKADDFEAVVGIDKKVFKTSRLGYYQLKFDNLIKSREYVPTSLVAEEKDGKIVGYIMGELYMGEFGISQEKAILDTLGVDLEYQHKSYRQAVGSRICRPSYDVRC